MMKLKQLESLLSNVNGFQTPKIALEQYPTSAHLAARLMHTAAASGDIYDCHVLDLGCGTGMLAIAAVFLGGESVVGVEIDADALHVAFQNFDVLEVDVDLLQMDARTVAQQLQGSFFDTIITNPPFGTRDKGADVRFLESAIQLKPKVIYSLHKTSTREFLRRKAEKEWNVNFEVLAILKFDIPKMYAFHTKQVVDVQVDLLRLTLKKEQEGIQKSD